LREKKKKRKEEGNDKKEHVQGGGGAPERMGWQDQVRTVKDDNEGKGGGN